MKTKFEITHRGRDFEKNHALIITNCGVFGKRRRKNMNRYPFKLNTSIFRYNSLLDVSFRENTGSFSMHWHDYYEIEVVVAGGGNFVFNGISYEVKAGQLCFVSPIDFHSLSMKDSDLLMNYNISFVEELMSDTLMMFINKLSFPLVIEPDKKSFERIVKYCDTIVEIQGKEDRMTGYYLKNLLECLVLEIMSCSKYKEGAVYENSSYVRKALEYIKNNFTDDITSDDVSAYCGFSKSHMYKMFKEFTGLTMHDYILEMRCRYAKNLIMSTDIAVIDICFESGFSSYSQFARNFKSIYGVSPNACRNEKV